MDSIGLGSDRRHIRRPYAPHCSASVCDAVAVGWLCRMVEICLLLLSCTIACTCLQFDCDALLVIAAAT